MKAGDQVHRDWLVLNNDDGTAHLPARSVSKVVVLGRP